MPLKLPTGAQEKKARQWMMSERDFRAIIVKNVAKAEVSLSEMCVTDRSIGGLIDPYPSPPDSIAGGSWHVRRKEDATEAKELENWFPDWSEVAALRARKYANNVEIEPAK